MKKPSFGCLVESCQEVFWNDHDRRYHLIQHHQFPASYDFHDPKKFIRKFQQKQSQKIHSPYKPKLQTTMKDVNKQSKTDTAVVDMKIITDSSGGVQPGGGNRAQRRAAKRAEYGTIVGQQCTTPQHQVFQQSASMDSTDMGGKESPVCTGHDSLDARAVLADTDSILITERGLQRDTAAERTERKGSCVRRSDPPHENKMSDSTNEMQVDDDIELITQGVRKTSIHVPSKISFGRRKGHHW